MSKITGQTVGRRLTACQCFTIHLSQNGDLQGGDKSIPANFQNLKTFEQFSFGEISEFLFYFKIITWKIYIILLLTSAIKKC